MALVASLRRLIKPIQYPLSERIFGAIHPLQSFCPFWASAGGDEP
jgi:hypothetical protein